jgi:glycosyltransferase involved in cell wall biosynthesis
MTKLIIQIPCYNEEATLGITLSALPKEVPGVDAVEWLIIDDGSTDKTVDVAKAHGVDHIISLPRHQGLSRAFEIGLQASVKAGADIIVNTDADNQYSADDIPILIAPILQEKADIVIGTRAISEIRSFSLIKKCLQYVGSWLVRQASQTNIPDATSGFRAINRDAAMQLHVFNSYTYTIETIIQASQKGITITSVPVRTNEPLRPSRLVRSTPVYIQWQVLTIIRIFMIYKPFRFFATPGIASFLTGILISLRFVYSFVIHEGDTGKVQSLILAALLMGMGFFLVIIGLLAELIAVNRNLVERLHWRLQKVEEQNSTPESHEK